MPSLLPFFPPPRPIPTHVRAKERVLAQTLKIQETEIASLKINMERMQQQLMQFQVWPWTCEISY